MLRSLLDRRWFIPSLVGIVALATRIPNLSRPPVLVFDEIFYANDALDLLTHGAERGFAAHPPLGKWMIAISIRAFGFTPTGWRVAPLLAGAIVAGLASAIVAYRTTSRLLQLAVGLLVVFDGITFVTSRLALLDGLVALWTTALLLLLTAVLVRGPRRADAFVAGALLGAACATKWSAIPLIPVVLVVFFLAADGRVAVRAGLHACARCLGVAVLVYVAAFGGWLLHGGGPAACDPRCPTNVATRTASLWRVQADMGSYQLRLKRTNSSLAPAWTWVLQTRPTTLFRQSCAVDEPDRNVCGNHHEGTASLRARGSVVFWLFGTVSILYLVARRHRGSVLLAAFALTLWLPWLVVGKSYSFYGATLVPVLAVAIGSALSTLGRAGRLILVMVLAAALVQFVVGYAALAGLPS